MYTCILKKYYLVTSTFIFLLNPIAAQDSTYRMSPSGTTIVEGRFIFANLPEDYIGESRTVDKGRWNGLGLSLHSSIFANVDETRRFRSGDYIGIAGGIGGSRHGFWFTGRLDLGWQVHYAITPRSDFGFRTYGMYSIAKLPFRGIMFHPSFRFGGLYLDFAAGIPLGYPADRPNNFGEFNFRILFPNEDKTETDRWYVGFKMNWNKGINYDAGHTDAIYSEFHITAGLML